jgi:hypothetical protein
MKFRRRSSTRSMPIARAARSMSRSMRTIASGRPAPRYGPSGAALVSTIFTSIWSFGMT